MALTLLHTADWQIGKPFARFPADIAARLQAARLESIDRLAVAALDGGAVDVLVAGDVFDSAQAPDSLIRQVMMRLASYPALVWHLLPGNHDPARPGGLWSRAVRLGAPVNVVLHLEPKAHVLGSGGVLLPAPLAAREMASDPTRWMGEYATPAGSIRIGFAHGSVQGFGSLGEAAVPIDAGRRLSAGLAYLALGDWHGAKEVAPGVWYSGTPEPDSFADNGPGNALLVRIEGADAPPHVEVVETAAHRWLERRVVMSRVADLQPIEDEIGRLGPERSRAVLALRLEGALPAGDVAVLGGRLEALAGAVMHLEGDRRRLRISLAADELAQRFPDPALAAIAARLVGDAETCTGREAQVAARALNLLLAMAASELGPAGEGGREPTAP
jgi:DNA repair exonuclease SbcCD nuclease subunit